MRLPGTSSGLTRRQAEKQLRELMADVVVVVDVTITVEVAGAEWIELLEDKGRAKSHVQSVESHLRVHLVPFFKDVPLERIRDVDVTRLLTHMRRAGLAPKTRRNVVSTLHSIFELGVRRRWVSANPCKRVDVPVVAESVEIRFLTQVELEAVLAGGIPADETS